MLLEGCDPSTTRDAARGVGKERQKPGLAVVRQRPDRLSEQVATLRFFSHS
jgi:hypothetical protein